MIKIDDGRFYITAGDACYILSSRGELCHIYMGKRVEYEDDLSALGIPPRAFVELAGFTVTGGEILNEKPALPLSLPGGKTLKINLVRGDLAAEVYITPYPRGGFTRRTVMTNNGLGPAVIDPPTAATVVGAQAYTVDSKGELVCGLGSEKRTCKFFGAAYGGGGAYGFVSVYADGEAIFGDNGRLTVAPCEQKTTLAAGETAVFPEILIAYCDGDIYGVSRVIHDIIRDAIPPARAQVALFCPALPTDRLCKAAAIAGELGIDVFAVDADAVDMRSLKKVGAACADAGVKLGLRVSLEARGKAGAICLAQETDGIIDGVENAVKACGAQYVSIGLPADVKRYAPTVYALSRRLEKAGVAAEWGTVDGHYGYAQSLCYPLCMLRNLVTRDGSLKTQFDRATLGKLAYAFDPTELSPELLRAVRAQVLSYQDDAPLALGGDLYRSSGVTVAVSKDKSAAYAVCRCGVGRARLAGLDEHGIYRVRELDKTFSGAALSSCGVPLPDADANATFTLHLRQVADFD